MAAAMLLVGHAKEKMGGGYAYQGRTKMKLVLDKIKVHLDVLVLAGSIGPIRFLCFPECIPFITIIPWLRKEEKCAMLRYRC